MKKDNRKVTEGGGTISREASASSRKRRFWNDSRGKKGRWRSATHSENACARLTWCQDQRKEDVGTGSVTRDCRG